jgi:hypothetical protein
MLRLLLMADESEFPLHEVYPFVSMINQRASRTNSFFDKVNREFFQPRGLYCLVMTWNPELPDAPSTAVDLNSLVSNAAGSASSQSSNTLGRLRHRFKSSNGKAYGNIFPEVAPLIFPEIDRLASDQNAGKKLSKMKRRKEFVGGYLDKRAQAKFVSIKSFQ